MTKIFISYRRADTKAYAGRLYDRLVTAFGRTNIFMDVDNIPAGADFRGVLRHAVSTCDVILVLIGSSWVTIQDEKGKPRLDDPDDFVRLEVETALQRQNAKVIPVYVGGADTPKANQLPLALRELAFRNGVPLRDNPDFHPDVDRLIEKIRGRKPSLRYDLLVFGIILLLLLGAGGWWIAGREEETSSADNPISATPTVTDSPTDEPTTTLVPTDTPTQTLQPINSPTSTSSATLYSTDKPIATDEPAMTIPPTQTFHPTEIPILPTASFTALSPTITYTNTSTSSPTEVLSIPPTLRTATVSAQNNMGQIIASSLNQLKVIYPFPSYNVNPTVAISPNTIVKIISCEIRSAAQWHNIEFGNPAQNGWIPTEYLVQPVSCP
jgi:hypothetical protein